jgi:hypothetical protein
MPDRIKLERKKGWRLPEGAMSVGRGTHWGNPFTVAGAIENGFAENKEQGRKVAVEYFRRWLAFEDPADSNIYITNGGRYERKWMRDHLADLRGKSLACWCPLPAEGEPDICHGAVLLLAVANGWEWPGA